MLFHLCPFKQFSVKSILFLQIVGETSKDFRRQELAEIVKGVITARFSNLSNYGTHLG
jgi:hypothetical protein